MPQVKIKQGTKSSINNNAGILNAGTLAITTDTNELFVTHNDGTVHQLCDNVNKSGDTMTGNLNMSGNSFENAGFEVVASLPTNNFIGRQVTYQGRSYIWDGSAWKCDSDYLEIGGRNLLQNSLKIAGATSASGITSVVNSDGSITFNVNSGNGNWIALGFMSSHTIANDVLQEDDDFVISFEVKNTDANYLPDIYVKSGLGYYPTKGILTTVWKRVYYTGKWKQASYISIHLGVGHIVGTFSVRRFKLEKGNKATDWTPAPEDKADVNHNHDSTYLGITDTAANSDKLDGKHASEFSLASHKYHPFGYGQYFFDDYEQGNFFRLFTENAAFDTVRFSAINTVQYYDGSNWVDWLDGLNNIKILLDGNESTSFNVTHTYRRFRFNVLKSSGWPTLATIVLQGTWTGLAFPSTTVKIENSSDNSSWVLVETCNFNSTNTSNIHGSHVKTSGNLHDGSAYSRVTIEMDDWTDNGVYTEIPLKRFMILSNFSGRKLQAFSTDYNKKVSFEGSLGVNGAGDNYFNGALGIGTTNPGVRFVNSGASLASFPTLGSGVVGANAILSQNGLYGLYTGVSANGDVWQQVQRNDTDISTYRLLLNPLGGNVGIGLTAPSEKLHVDGNVKANGYKVGSGNNTKLLTDGGGTKLISDFAPSNHNHEGVYSTTDTKNTAGATNTASKIYLVGSTDQTANPQTYTHDTAYVDIDGSVYSGSSKTITVSDLVTNQIVTPTLNPTWTIKNYAGTAVSSPTNPSGEAITGTTIVLEYGFKPSMTVKGKWIAQAGYDNPTSCSGLCGTSLPASNVETAATSSIDLYNSTTYSSTTVPITTSAYWTIATPKKGITISGSSLVLPTGNISASARVQVTYQLPIYYGNITSLTIIEADVKALSTKTWKNYQASSKSVSPTINSSDSEYWIYAYPAAWGSLSTISNADGDWTAAFTTANTISITGAPGLAITYNYYITVNKGAFKNKVINFS